MSRQESMKPDDEGRPHLKLRKADGASQQWVARADDAAIREPNACLASSAGFTKAVIAAIPEVVATAIVEEPEVLVQGLAEAAEGAPECSVDLGQGPVSSTTDATRSVMPTEATATEELYTAATIAIE